MILFYSCLVSLKLLSVIWLLTISPSLCPRQFPANRQSMISEGIIAEICAEVDSTPLMQSTTVPPPDVAISLVSGFTDIPASCSFLSRSTPFAAERSTSSAGRMILRSVLLITGDAVTTISFKNSGETEYSSVSEGIGPGIAGSCGHAKGAVAHNSAYIVDCLYI